MDHLPFLAEAEGVPERVPYLKPDHDLAGAFSSVLVALPEMTSTAAGSLANYLQHGLADESTDAALQQMLWFGLLAQFHHAIEVPFDPERYIASDAGGKYLTTKPFITQTVMDVLLATQDEYRRSVINPDPMASTAVVMGRFRDRATVRLPQVFWHYERAYNILCSAYHTGMGRVGFHNGLVRRRQIFVASAILYELLDAVAAFFMDGSRLQAGKTLDMYNLSDHIFEEARARGWCPSRTCSMYNESMSLLHVVARNLPARRDEVHQDCTRKECRAVYTHSNNEHAPGCSGDCKLLSARRNDLCSIISAGSIPIVISSKPDADGFLQIKPASTENQYCAVSHVWAHGLGNDSANALRSCHLDRLFAMAHRVCGDKVGLWIDTLCVPVASRDKLHRRNAISRMHATYKDAKGVIIMDKRLLETEARLMVGAQLELLLCDWMYRLWTLQEAIIPGTEKVWVMFKNREVTLRHLMSSTPALGGNVMIGIEIIATGQLNSHFILSGWADAMPPTATDELVMKKLARSRPDLDEDSVLAIGTGYIKLSMLIRCLGLRTTTKAEDEPLCLATLLNLNLSIMSPRPSLHEVLLHLERVPQNLMFCHGPRLQQAGFRWAPKSFLGRNIPGEMLGDLVSTARVTPQGLRLAKSGVLLRSDIQYRRGGSNRYHVKIRDRNVDGPFLLILEELEDQPDEMVLTKVSLLLMKSKDLQKYVDSHTHGTSAITSSVVLVQRTREVAGVQYAHYLGRGTLHCRFQYSHEWSSYGFRRAEETTTAYLARLPVVEACLGSWLGELAGRQEWCIDGPELMHVPKRKNESWHAKVWQCVVWFLHRLFPLLSTGPFTWRPGLGARWWRSGIIQV